LSPVDSFVFKHEERFQYERLDGLDQDHVDASVHTPLTSVLISIAREGNDEAAVLRKIEPELSCHLTAVHVRHGDV
jgi:hypothetical protein